MRKAETQAVNTVRFVVVMSAEDVFFLPIIIDAKTSAAIISANRIWYTIGSILPRIYTPCLSASNKLLVRKIRAVTDNTAAHIEMKKSVSEKRLCFFITVVSFRVINVTKLL